MTTRKEQDAHSIIDRYMLTGCYTVDDWNVYAAACKVLGLVPLIDPRECKIPINRV
jgi:hypothetical protein